MKNRRISPANLFLLELVIVICFFALGGTIITQVFLKANELTTKSVEQNQALMLAESSLETVRSLPFSQQREGVHRTYFDKEWVKSSREAAEYELTLTINRKELTVGKMIYADCNIKNVREKTPVFELKDQKYYKGEESK